MQIKNLILYKDEARQRILHFKLGTVNIITGESKSGKTALINIIDYCLGSKECKIADGVIRDTVEWFAITVVFEDGEYYFIARQNPNKINVSSTSEIVLIKSNEDTIPIFQDLQNNSNIGALISFLSKKIGISENLQRPTENTRTPLAVNFRHAIRFSFQPQTLIAQQDYLFYKQTEQFIPQSIKDSLPYFLGVIREDALLIEQEITRKTRELNILIRQKKEQEKIYEEGLSLAFSLIDEAKEIGIIDNTIKIDSLGKAYSILNSIKNWEIDKNITNIQGENETLKALIYNRNKYKTELSDIEDKIFATKEYLKNNLLYSEELHQQKIRLESINLYNNENGNNNICPLCNSLLKVSIPSITAIQLSLENLNNQLNETIDEKPRLNEYIQNLQNLAYEKKRQIKTAENSITALYNELEKAKHLRDLNLRRGKVIGRVSLFLESKKFVEDTQLSNKILLLQSEIDSLTRKIDKESKDDKMQSIIAKINQHMSNWVKCLDVEHDDALIRFNLSKLTLIAETDDKSIPLSQLGSGANWVSYHLLIHFALHEHFIQENRPVPRFIMIDQPTQVYFPPEKDTTQDGHIQESSDETAVKKMFNFIIERTNHLNSKFQVIITDHAYLNDDNFKKCVTEIWRNGTKLIPQDWINDNK